MQMKYLLPFAAGCSVLVAATGVSAATKREQAPDDKVICQTVGVTGSRLNTKRICLTAEQWRQSRREMKQDLETAQKIPGMPND
jgi:hypothetical protein